MEGICELTSSSQPWLKHRKNSKDDDRNGKHEKLDGQSDEHFGDADLFAGHTGGNLTAPTNNLSEPDSRDGGSEQHYDWTTYRQKETVKHAIQSIDHVFIPKVIFVDVELPGNPLRAHLVETRDLKHGGDGESCKQKEQHAEQNYACDSFCGDASLSSQGKQDADTSFN